MSRIPIDDLEIIEKAIYLPILLTILQRDLQLIEKNAFKLKKPYVNLIEDAIVLIQLDSAKLKKYMRQHKMKVHRLKSDKAFTMYCFFYKGYEEFHNYFNPKLQQKTEELLGYYIRKGADAGQRKVNIH